MAQRSSIIVTLMLITACALPLAGAQEHPDRTHPPGETEPAPIPTATLGGVALHFVRGAAHYQNRQPDSSGIEVQVLDESLNLLGVARTDAQGIYAVTVPIDAFYWLVTDAPLHRRQVLPMQPGDALPTVILAGGDVNNDGCIGPSDLAVLVAMLDVTGSAATDVTGDGITDVSDLAIVTGNYQPHCEPEITETPIAEIESTVEITPELTPEIEATAEVAPEPMPDVTPEAGSTPEATAEVTPEAMPETPPVMEVTEEITPEVTAEMTAEAAPETPAPTLAPVPSQTPLPTITPEPVVTQTFTPAPTWTYTPTETPSEAVYEGTEESTT